MGLSIDRGKVIKGLTFCSMGLCFDGCPYHKVSQNIDECTSQLALEALELLEEQEKLINKLEYDLAVAQNNLNYYINGND